MCVCLCVSVCICLGVFTVCKEGYTCVVCQKLTSGISPQELSTLCLRWGLSVAWGSQAASEL